MGSCKSLAHRLGASASALCEGDGPCGRLHLQRRGAAQRVAPRPRHPRIVHSLPPDLHSVTCGDVCGPNCAQLTPLGHI